MAKNKDYKNTLSQLGEKLKKEPPTTPIQEVRPIDPGPATSTPKKEHHVNFWVPESLMIRLKIHAAKSGTTIKQMGVEALEEYLKKHE